MTKILRVTMSDGSVWDIPADHIARERAKYYADLDAARDGLSHEERDALFLEEVDRAMSDDYEIKDWASNNMNWRDVETVAKRVSDRGEVNYSKDWINANKQVIEVRP